MGNVNLNRALLYGEGLFETILWKGVNRKLRRHYERLAASAGALNIPYPTFEDFISEIKGATGNETDLYVKYCLISEGEGVFYRFAETYRSLVIRGVPPTAPDSVRLTYSPYGRHSKDPLVYHKSTNYLFNVFVKREALARGFYDAIILNEKGLITECSTSNILLVKDSAYLTPARDSGLLWGTTLSVLTDYMTVAPLEITPLMLENSDEVYILNSLIGAVPVSSIDNKVFRVNCDRQARLLETLRIEDP